MNVERTFGRARNPCWAPVLLFGAVLLAAAATGNGAPLAAAIEPSQRIAASPVLLAEGAKLYQRQCAACHGAEGHGDGPAAYLLYPKPRALTAGRYRLVSTWEGVPTDDDLYRTISRGMPGSAMPSWSHLSERERWALVDYVKSLSERPLEVKASTAPEREGALGTGIVIVPPEPSYDAAAEARARELFTDACASCHGATARGDGVAEQRDEQGFPTRPRDLTAGVFKGSPEPEDLYRRIIAGLPGSPMPASDWAYGDDAWHLVHFVRTLSSDALRSRAEMRRFAVEAPRVAALPSHPDGGGWAQATPVNLHLMPLWWRDDRPEEVTVRALHDGKSIALLLVWRDDTHDATVMRPQDFRDAAAVQLARTADPPFFAMGEAAGEVDIWMWKSERQADLEPAFQDLEKIYPNLGIDSYPNLLRSPLEQPMRNALTLGSDPTFVTAWAAGNIVADPTRPSAVEDLTARGFGTLRARPRTDQLVEAHGVYGTGSYRVMFRRPLAARGRGSLAPGAAAPVAFAVWDGDAGDRDGKKSVTVWQELRLAK